MASFCLYIWYKYILEADGTIYFKIAILGIFEDFRIKRNQKNLVSAKKNFMAWSLEVDYKIVVFVNFYYFIIASFTALLPWIETHIGAVIWRSINLAAPPFFFLIMLHKGIFGETWSRVVWCFKKKNRIYPINVLIGFLCVVICRIFRFRL